MVKLNRTTEYSLLAISYIRGKGNGEMSSAREIADRFDLPFEILAKTLQKLKDQGIIASSYGTRGGYILARNLETLNLAEFLKLMEGPIGVVACAHNAKQPAPTLDSNQESSCEYSSHCTIRPMMTALNERVYEFLHQISIDELTRNQSQLGRTHVSTTDAAGLPTGLSGIQGEEP